MKPIILAEKPSQEKAYADAFSVKRQDGYLEILPSPIFPASAICLTHGYSTNSINALKY
nr:hypothetical protein [Psychrobacillus sp.]